MHGEALHGVGHTLQREAEETPACFCWTHIASIQVVLYLIGALQLQARAVVAFVHVLEEIFHGLQRRDHFDVDVAGEATAEVGAEEEMLGA